MTAHAKTLPNTHRRTVCSGISSPPKGVTYFVERQGWVKIGKTTQRVERRVKALARRAPGILCPDCMDMLAPLVLLGVIREDVEHTLHQRFAQCHVIGEWFRPDAAMRSWMRVAL